MIMVSWNHCILQFLKDRRANKGHKVRHKRLIIYNFFFFLLLVNYSQDLVHNYKSTFSSKGTLKKRIFSLSFRNIFIKYTMEQI